MPTTAAADPPVAFPGNPKIAGTFTIKPTSGAVGTTMHFKGWCGFPTTQVIPVLGIEIPEGVFALVFPAPTTIDPTPLGFFSVDLTIPSEGNATSPPTPITPGAYVVWVVCGWPPQNVTVLPPQPFTVTSVTEQ
jgi:hypothetical protein